MSIAILRVELRGAANCFDNVLLSAAMSTWRGAIAAA
jgi:hypothetical protein